MQSLFLREIPVFTSFLFARSVDTDMRKRREGERAIEGWKTVVVVERVSLYLSLHSRTFRMKEGMSSLSHARNALFLSRRNTVALTEREREM